ncbi:hypothetical protein DFO67_11026 [Modicisalibacter xianhensis]|uniref:Uncharacterized protein n=1 Tax=Modicisalibacter xianhensis TaxID=442341 RepID=A0A4R8FPF1_9GAMM|nr:hypothetical protein DFO67_11026 [Halomonas xianhensis]
MAIKKYGKAVLTLHPFILVFHDLIEWLLFNTLNTKSAKNYPVSKAYLALLISCIGPSFLSNTFFSIQ